MKKILLAVFILTLILTAVPLTAFAQSDTGSVYSDISGKWFADAAAKHGYTEIFSDGSGKFSPDREITRIEFVRLLHKALGISINYFAAPDVKDYFDDMDNTGAGANELIDLATTGIVESGGSFDPDKSLDRDLMIHWIMNALKYKTDGNYPIPMVKPVPFNDDGEITDAYRGEIYSSVVLKLVNGRGDNMLYPKNGATRAEAVTIVSRLMTLLDSYQSAVDVTASAQLAGDGSLTMSLTIRNNTDKAVAISHTSGQKYDFKLFDAKSDNLYTWSADKMFAAFINETVIGPGEEIVFSDTLDSEAYGAMKQAVSMKAYIVGTSDDFTIDINGYAAEIVN
ncbi:MAG TPA: BsuPI-related putative proteinase inhibitor [Syntrophomonas sp.]|nr:BsuPI-related putative proteinase inhibitor [Syntrophomonas sp.]